MREKIIRFGRWITDKYILLMLFVFPLFTGFSGYAAITRSKYLFFTISTGAWLLVIVVCRSWVFFSEKRSPQIPDVCCLAVMLFMLACVVSALLSPYREYVLLGAGRYDGLLTLLLCAGIFLGVRGNAEAGERYIYALSISAALCSAVAAGQLFGVDFLRLFPGGYTYYDSGTLYTGQFLGTIGNTNLLSGFLCIVLPSECVLFVCGGGKKSAVLAVSAVLCLFVLTASGVAAGAVALCAAAVIALPLVIRTKERLCRALILLAALAPGLYCGLSVQGGYAVNRSELVFDWTKWLPLLSLTPAALGLRFFLVRKNAPGWGEKTFLRVSLIFELICVIIALLALYFIPWQSGTIYELSRVLHGEIDDSFGSQRIQIWREVLRIVPERLFFGGGPDTLVLRLELGFSRYVEETGQTLSVYVDNAHNEYLGHLVNLGLAGLLSYLACMVTAVLRFLRKRPAKPEYLALFCGLVCYWVQSFFGLGLCIVTPIMWLCWGLLCSDTFSEG